MTLLTVNNLTLSFATSSGEKTVVRHASFNIQAGEMFTLVGESGSGKTLSALATIGLAPAAAHITGNVHFEGEELIGAPESRLRHLRGDDISMIFQEPMTALNPLHTIGKQIAEMIIIHQQQLSRKAVFEKVESLLDEVGLGHLKTRLDAYPHQLSGGERQRVMIAMAIANNPKLLIADEPTTAVDVTVQAKILQLLKRLQKERNMAMLFITHDLTIVQKMADKVAIMRAGEMVEQGAVTEVFAAPKHAYTQQLLGSAPKGAPEPLKANAKDVLVCENLSVHYPIKQGVLRRTVGVVKAADDISFNLKTGETLGVVGESGSGKTTLGLALLKLAPAQGRVVFQSREMQLLRASEVKMLRQHMQIVFQDPFASLNPRMTVGDIVAEGLRVHAPHLTTQQRDEKVSAVLQEVGLSADSAERYPHEFSGGQRQRIAIARALILEPSLLILDEPTSALDLTVQAQIVELLRKFQREKDLSYIFISHDLRVVKALAHRIIVMQKGKVVEKGDAAQILTQPREIYTQELMKAAL